MAEMADNNGIIFQVRINEDEDFELVKTDLSPLQQAAFERFLESYLSALKEERVKIFKEEYDL